MNLKAFRKDKNGNIHTNSLSKEMLIPLPNILKQFLTSMHERGNPDFDVNSFGTFIRNHFSDVEPYLSTEKVSNVRLQRPGKKYYIDIQNVCYHLSDPGSFWIEDDDTNQRMVVFGHVDQMHYSILNDWDKYFK